MYAERARVTGVQRLRDSKTTLKGESRTLEGLNDEWFY